MLSTVTKLAVFLKSFFFSLEEKKNVKLIKFGCFCWEIFQYLDLLNLTTSLEKKFEWKAVKVTVIWNCRVYSVKETVSWSLHTTEFSLM